MTIQAVFFDMGGTIENFWHTPELRLNATPGIQQRLLDAGIDLHLTNEQLYELVTAGLFRYHQWSMQTLDELPPQRVWREYVLDGCPVDAEKIDSIAEDLMVYIETHYYHREMRPEIPAVLAAIRAMGLKIGLISNVNSRGQVPYNLDQYNIRHYFDPIVLSSEYGRRKPDPAIFHYAARLANVPTSECIHVGDRISRDVVGARKAGYRMVIQIRHDLPSSEEDEGAAPDVLIENMTELLDILRVELGSSTGLNGKKEVASNCIRALLFDAGDILYFRPQRDRKFNTFLKDLGLDDEDSHAAERKSILQRAYQGWMNQEQYQEAILRLYGVAEPEDIQRGKKILDEEDNNIQFFPGVRKTLIALKDQGFLLGIITDTALPVHVKLSWFERGGFGDVWDSIVSSRELGMRKPNPKIYQAALHQLGLPAGQAVFVGHKASELEGARAVGMKTIAFNYEEAAKANYYIETFRDILKVPILANNPSEQATTQHD